MTAGPCRSPVSILQATPKAVALGIAVLLPSPVSAQNPSNSVVIIGRVEEALSREPVGRASVVSGDSTTTVFADSLGNFAIPLDSTPPYVVRVAQFGYETTTFELPSSAPSSLAILILNPAPLAVEGVTVVAETALSNLVERLEQRRGGYFGSVRAYDVDRLLSEGPGSAMDFVRQRSAGVSECFSNSLSLCRRRGSREVRVLLCIDDIESWGPVADLESIPIEEIFLVEFYGPTSAWGLSGGPSAFGRDATRRSAGGLLGGPSLFGGNGTQRTAGQVRVYTRNGTLGRLAGGRRPRAHVNFGC